MASSNFNLSGIPHEVMILLKKEAARKHTSVNTLILKMIEQGLTDGKSVYHDLDHLAGTWSKVEGKAFKKNISHFEQIEK